jgi:transcriptional regulator with XRE-family HTH domain
VTRKKTPPASLKIFGAQSRLLRERLDWTMKDLEKRIPYSESMIAMVERGERPPKPLYAIAVDEALGAQGMLTEAAKHLGEEDHPEWAQEYMELEAKALALHVYDNQVVNGLLQTEEYARAVFRSLEPVMTEEEVEHAVQARLARQKLLHRVRAPRLTFVLQECVLRRPIGGKAVRDEQLRHLLKCATLPYVLLQVMPENRETHAALDGPMTLLETPEHLTLGYVEGQRGSFFLSDAEDISALSHRYGILRSQALDPEGAAELIERILAGER